MPTAWSHIGPRLPERPTRIAAIALGGSLGTLARYGADRRLAPTGLGFPWATLVVNVSGSLLLGLVLTLVVERWPPTRFVRPLVAVGFCGGFTTFSTMVVEAAQRGQHGRVGPAAVYLLVSLTAGLAAAAAGVGLARGRIRSDRGDGPIPDPDDVGRLDGGRSDRARRPGGNGTPA